MEKDKHLISHFLAHIHHWQTKKFHRRHAWRYEWHTVCGRRHTSSMNESIEMPSSCWFSYIYFVVFSLWGRLLLPFVHFVSFRIYYIYLCGFDWSIVFRFSQSSSVRTLVFFASNGFVCFSNAENRLVCARVCEWKRNQKEEDRVREDRKIFRWIENRIKWREKTVCDNQNDFRLMVFAAILLSIAFFLSSLFHHFSSFSYMRLPLFSHLASHSDIWFWSLVLVRSFSDCVPYYYCQRREIVRKGRRIVGERERDSEQKSDAYE